MPAYVINTPTRLFQTGAYGDTAPTKAGSDGNFNGFDVKLGANKNQEALALALFVGAVADAADRCGFDVGVIAVGDAHGRLLGVAVMIWPRHDGHPIEADTDGAEHHAEHRAEHAHHHAERRWHPAGYADFDDSPRARASEHTWQRTGTGHAHSARTDVPPHFDANVRPEPPADAPADWVYPMKPHEALGVSRGETDLRTLKEAWMAASKKYHPDKADPNLSAQDKAANEETFKALKPAYEWMVAKAKGEL